MVEVIRFDLFGGVRGIAFKLDAVRSTRAFFPRVDRGRRKLAPLPLACRLLMLSAR